MPSLQGPKCVKGDHALCCGNEGERIARHNALRDALHSTAVAASLGTSKEVRFLLPGSDRRPADVFLHYWSGGRDTVWDVTHFRKPEWPRRQLHQAMQLALAWQTGQEEGVATGHLFQKLSVLLMKVNSAMISNRQPGLVPS